MKLFHRNIDYRKDVNSSPGEYFTETMLQVDACSRGLF